MLEIKPLQLHQVAVKRVIVCHEIWQISEADMKLDDTIYIWSMNT